MNRSILFVTAVLSASSPLLADSAVKGTVLVVLTAGVAMLLKRDSAATRHLVWQLAIFAMLGVPVLSAMLPQWRVLPAWASHSPVPTADNISPSLQAGPAERAVDVPQTAVLVEVERPTLTVDQPATTLPDPLPAPATVEAVSNPTPWTWKWFDALPLFWAIGFSVLMLRLSAARWLLWNSERRGKVIWSSTRTATVTHDPIVTELEAVCLQLKISRPVTLLLHPDKMIPVVWGILRCRLLLPVSARQWSDEQLRSVLLHELAHVKRLDTAAQLLTQIACALHWFNPLVWFAAWRLDVERERACDDLVLASGVRPSAYAGHLLEVVTGLSPARWAQSCGLAMARKSSLEGRLAAVLGKDLNRRDVSVALAGLALAIAVGIAVPIAMLRAVDRSVEAATNESIDDGAAPQKEAPRNTTATFLLSQWQDLEGRKTPLSETSIARLRVAIDKWVKQPTAQPDAARVMKLRNWQQERPEHPVAEVEAWLDEIAAIHPGSLAFAIRNEILAGSALSAERQTALQFGPVAENGLRAAWSRFPVRESYLPGDVIACRLVIQNVSEKTVEFECPHSLESIITWEAKTANGREVEAKPWRTTGTFPLFTWQLEPGAIAEIHGRDVAIGEGGSPLAANVAVELSHLKAKLGEQITVHWKVREPVEMNTDGVSFKVVDIADMPAWSTMRAGQWPLPGGVKLEVKQQFVHAADVSSSAILTWPTDKSGNAAEYRIWLGGDAFSNRAPWQLAWERDATVLWTMSGERQSPQTFHKVTPTPNSIRRIDFSNPMAITETNWSYVPELVPAVIREEFAKVFLPLATTPHTPAHAAPSDRTEPAKVVRSVTGSEQASVPPQEREDIALKPKHKDARELYEIWQRHARANGDIPGALVGELATAVKTFIGYNPTWETLPKLNALLPRLDATHDWKPADVIALLDEVPGIQDSPLKSAPWKGMRHTIRQGEALPKRFADAPWGDAQNGLRAAWVLEPDAAEHRLGEAVKARLLVQNQWPVPVMLQVPTWYQGWVKASDAKDVEVEVSGIEWTTLAQLVPVRLAPGEYIEIRTPGIGFGPRAGMGPWAGPRVGSNVLAKAGDELTLTHGLVPLDGSEVGVSEDDPHVSGPGWWLAHIKARLNRELPLPTDAADRTRLLDRAVRELFATAPSAEETAEFIADKTPGALDALAKRLATRVDLVSFSGKLPTAPAKFRVLAADPNAHKQPRVVLGPGEYPLPSASAERGDATLKIVGRPVGDRRTNEAQLLFEPVEFTGILPPDPHKLEVPDGWGTWAIVCRPSDGFFYLLHKGSVRKIDYSKPRKVTDTPANDLPAEFRDEVKRQLDIHEISDAQQAEIFEKPAAAPAASLRSDEQEKPKTAATELQPKTTEKVGFTAWGKEVGGLQAGLGFKAGEKRVYTHGEWATLVVRVRNVGKDEVKFQYIRQFFVEQPPTVFNEKGELKQLGRTTAFGEHIPVEVKLAAGREIELYELKLYLGTGSEEGKPKYPYIFGTGKFQVQYEKVLGNSSSRLIKLDPALSKLATGKLELEIKPVAPPQPETPKPKSGAMVKPATEQKLKWGEPVNGLRMALAWPPTLSEPGLGDAPEFYLVVQNVSQAAVRFTANDAAQNPRRLFMRDEAGILLGLKDEAPMPGDWLLQPRAAAFIRMYHPTERAIANSKIEEVIRSSPQYDMTAEMSIETAPPGAWTGKLKTGATRGSLDVIPPKHKDAQSLLKSWTTAARIDGNIPGALIGQLGESVKTFIKNNPTWETTPQLQKMLPRFDASRDWLGQDAVGLLDELAAVQSTPISMALDHENQSVIRTGTPLPAELANAPWGDAVSFDPPAYPHPNGLRVAWLLEPRAVEHRLGTPLKSRVLIHNSGKIPVVFRTRTWHQLAHKATDANGADLKVDSTRWTTRGVLLWNRLAPGEFIEVSGPGIGVGPMGNREDWQQTRVGSWVEAQAGDEVTVTTASLPLMDWGDEKQLPLDGEMRFWRDQVTARLSRHLPFPAGKAERERLLYRVALELFGTSVSQEINDSFVADMTPSALASLANRLHNRPGLHAWAGSLQSAPTKFRVLPADPDAAKKPRTANNPGQYTLNDKAMLVVTRRPIGERIVNEAHLVFAPPAGTIPGQPQEIKLPDGYDTWAASWVRGTTLMWVQQKGLLRRIDFSNYATAEESRYEADKAAAAPIPADIREALRAALDVPDAPKQGPEAKPPASSAPADAAP